MQYRDALVERFLRYVAISSQSDDRVSAVPSTEGQWELGRLLVQELKDLGLEDVTQDEHGIVTGLLKGNRTGPAIGFVSHLDTVDVALSPVIHPQIIDYQGGDVLLNAEQGIVMPLAAHPELKSYTGQKIIFTDGTSVLGADNKAAMANIMTALSIIVEEGRPHPDLYIAFVPDEEIGLKGSKLLNLERFKVDYAYTIDSCALGEVVYETFNAGSVFIDITGVTAHPMSSKGVLVNPILVAHDLIALFDRKETPECTDGKDGYWWFKGIHANDLKCSLTLHIRDFDKARYQYRIRCAPSIPAPLLRCALRTSTRISPITSGLTPPPSLSSTRPLRVWALRLTPTPCAAARTGRLYRRAALSPPITLRGRTISTRSTSSCPSRALKGPSKLP